MTWEDARDRLEADIADLGEAVQLTPPQIIDDEEIHVYLVPPARTPIRRPSHVKRTTFFQTITVMRHLPSEGDADVDAISKSVDRHVQRISDALDHDLQLGGYAVSVTPPEWEEMGAVEWPAQSGVYYARMVGRLEIEVETIYTP